MIRHSYKINEAKMELSLKLRARNRNRLQKRKNIINTHILNAPEITIATLPRHTLSLTLVCGYKLLKKLLPTI